MPNIIYGLTFLCMQALRYYLGAFSSLHTAKVKRYNAPHKAVLLLAALGFVVKNTKEGATWTL